MISTINNLKKERKSIRHMIQIYCKKFHESNKDLCKECREILTYANSRLDYCSFGENKPACSNCSIHCYNEDMRKKIKNIMRYSGPKMIFKHPILAISHLYKLKIKKTQIKN